MVNCLISWILHRFWLVLSNDLLEDRCTEELNINNLLLIHYIKQIDSMLLWICTVIVIEDTLSCTWCATYSFDQLLNRCRGTWHLFVNLMLGGLPFSVFPFPRQNSRLETYILRIQGNFIIFFWYHSLSTNEKENDEHLKYTSYSFGGRDHSLLLEYCVRRLSFLHK